LYEEIKLVLARRKMKISEFLLLQVIMSINANQQKELVVKFINQLEESQSIGKEVLEILNKLLNNSI